MPQNRSERLYPNLVEAVITALRSIFSEDQYADKVIQHTLKSNPKWGSSDRAFIAESVYEIVRWYRLLYTIAGGEPRSAADWWRLFGIYRLLNGYTPLPTWKEFEGLDPEAIARKHLEVQSERKIRESIPDWLDERGQAELGDHWQESLKALNEPAEVVLRANRLKTDSMALIKKLSEDQVGARKIGADSLLVTERKNLFATRAFKNGDFEVQDYSSQQVAPFLQPGPGMLVIDACAGGGGKSLHLATLMENKGRLIAMDTAAWKLEELKRRARRNGIHIIEPRQITGTKVIKRLYGKADRLLLDVPCSGLGVLRRNPDAKWKLSPDFIERVQQEQAAILDQYPKMLKAGGILVYATCSILPSENRQQVDRFLEKHPEFRLEEERSILPQHEGFDGFYMARMVKLQA